MRVHAAIENFQTVWRRPVEVVLLLVGLGFIAGIVVHHKDEFVHALKAIDGEMVFLAVLAAMPMYLLKAMYNARIIAALANEAEPRRGIVASYAVSQLVRYVPGKIWGVLYQSLRMSGQYRPEVVVLGNIVQYIFTNIFSLVVVMSIGLWHLGFFLPALLVLLGTVIVGHVCHKARRLGLPRYRFLRRHLERASGECSGVSGVRGAMFLLTFDWIVYLCMWRLIVPEGFDWSETMLLAALYSSASLLSVVAAIAPGGLVVREALFLLIGAQFGFSESLLLSLGIVSRLVLTMSELSFAVLTVWGARLLGRLGAQQVTE